MAVIGFEWNQQDDIVNHLSLTTNKSFILTGEGYKKLNEGNSAILSRNVIPKMTSNTAPSGIASASSEQSSSYGAWMAFNGISDAYGWLTTHGVHQGWLSYKFTSKKIIAKYSVTSGGTDSQSPKNWTFEGSNNSVDWDILDTKENQTAWGSLEKREYYFNNDALYSHYRINVSSDNGGAYLGVGELEMFEALIPATTPSWKTVSPTLPTLPQFQEEGMDDLSIFDRKVQTVLDNPQAMASSELGEGKVFRGRVDLKKYFDLRKLEVK